MLTGDVRAVGYSFPKAVVDKPQCTFGVMATFALAVVGVGAVQLLVGDAMMMDKQPNRCPAEWQQPCSPQCLMPS